MKDYKILWIANNPCSSTERGGGKTVTGGWHSALEAEIRDKVHLSIAFLSSGQTEEDFIHKGVIYHSINPFASENYFLFRMKRLLMPQRLQDKAILTRIREIIHLESPDLIHIHGTERCFGMICPQDRSGMYLLDEKRIPVLISIQGLIGAIKENFFRGLPQSSFRKYESLESKLRKQSALRLYREFSQRAETEKTILHRAAFICGRTDWDFIETAKFNSSRKYFKVGEIMRAPFYGRQWQPHGNQHTFTIVSTLSTGPYKGIDLLLKTAAKLQEENFPFRWLVIGYGKDNDYVRVARKQLGLDPEACGVEFLGKMDAEGVASTLLEGDVFCQVSHIENSPNSVCEAMLLGMPVVATNVGGTASIVTDGKDGILVDDAREDLMSQAVKTLASDSGLALTLSSEARKTALARHDPSEVSAEVLSVYREILEY